MNVPLLCSITGHKEKKALYASSASTTLGTTPTFPDPGMRNRTFVVPNPNGPGYGSVTVSLWASPSFGACQIAQCSKYSPEESLGEDTIIDSVDCSPGQCPKPVGLKTHLSGAPDPTGPGTDTTETKQGKWAIARTVSYTYTSQKYDITHTDNFNQWSYSVPATITLTGKVKSGASHTVTKTFQCDFTCRMCGGVLNCQNECPGDCDVFKYTHTNPNFEIYCEYCL